MEANVDEPADLPDSIVSMLDQQDPETLLAIHRRCEALLEEYDLEEEIESRTYG